VHAALVVCEVGLAMAVLVGAGLLVRTMRALFQTNVGFEPSHLLTGTVNMPRTDSFAGAHQAAFMQQGIDRIARLPGVESAGAVFPAPFTPQIYQVWLAIEGRAPHTGIEQSTYVSIISSGYLKTMKIPVLEGRGFHAADTSEESHTIVVDRVLAGKYWPGENPVGRSIKLFTQDFSDTQQKPWTVIGVAGAVRASGLDAEPEGRVYVLTNQLPNLTMTFVAWTATDPHSVAKSFEGELHALNSNMPVFNIQTMEDAMQSSQQPRRVAMLLLLSFSISALVLTTMGLYGILAHIVERRTSEIGVRLALGALPRDVMRLILFRGVTLSVAGIAIGILAALALSRLMGTLLLGIGSTDPLTFAAVTFVILCVTLAASYIPARRAMRVDPIVALRYE
jgi:putative ABC transport system permease protein